MLNHLNNYIGRSSWLLKCQNFLHHYHRSSEHPNMIILMARYSYFQIFQYLAKFLNISTEPFFPWRDANSNEKINSNKNKSLIVTLSKMIEIEIEENSAHLILMNCTVCNVTHILPLTIRLSINNLSVATWQMNYSTV